MTLFDRIAEKYPKAVIAEGYNDAIIGMWNERVVYSYEKILEILMSRDGMDYQGAIDFYYFNIDASSPDKGPIYVETDP